MPSTRAEGQTGGYDACLARMMLVLFLQFKLSDYLRRGRGKQRAAHPGSAYYRFPVYSRLKSQQHTLLRNLANECPEYSKSVYYVAPVFHEQAQLREHHNSGHIIEESFFCPLEKTRPLTDDDPHCITFTEAHPPNPHWHSPAPGTPIEGMRGADFLESISEDVAASSKRLSEPYFLDLITQIERQSKQSARRPASPSLSDLVEYAAWLSETVLGSTMVLIAGPDASS